MIVKYTHLLVLLVKPSFREVFTTPGGDVFQGNVKENDDEDELKWAAIERLSTYELQGVDGKVGIDIPKIEVRFEHLSIEGDAYVGSRALPTLWNATIIFGALEKIKIVPSKKRVVKILRDVSGIIKPSSLGVGTRYELLAELSRREKELGIKPDPKIDVFMKATAVAGQESSLVTGYGPKILGLDTCADIMVGDQMRRVSDHVVKERIKILEKEVSYMRENQERVLHERVELEVQQRVEQEVSRLRQQNDDRFKSMEEQWSRMMSDMTLSSRSFSNPTLPDRDSSNA
ncbi:hypothetical protein BC332_30679 [Capsicum chinense]|nr:hypothetical protein BC332_30679 [Capsicum chinense]